MKIVQIYYQNNRSVRTTQLALFSIYACHIRTAESVILAIMDRLGITFTPADNVQPQRSRTVRTENVIAAVGAAGYRRKLKCVNALSHATVGDLPIRLMED